LTLLLVACGVPCGFAVRRRLAHVLPRLVRAQMLLLATPLAFTAGLVFVPRFDAVAAMATLVTAEAAGDFAGGLLNERDGTQRVSLTASSSNTGIWAIPIAGVFLGPAAVSFVAVFDQMSFPRGLVLTSRLRRFAPTPQAARTALVDYAPAAALVCGLVLHGLLGRPDALASWLPRIGIASAVASMLLIGAALPSTRPQAVHVRHALLGALFRFVPATVGLTLLYLLGVHPPAAAWLLAFAPSYYSMLTLSRLYGYDGREAVATAITTTAAAAGILPLLLLALH
jgi:predicted permease